jgi:hypothetical protein
MTITIAQLTNLTNIRFIKMQTVSKRIYIFLFGMTLHAYHPFAINHIWNLDIQGLSQLAP